MKRTPEEIMERMDALLDEYEAATDKFDRGAFSDKYGERLGQYSDKLKSLNGDDFDIIGAAYDEHKKDYSDLSDDDYVNALEENIKKVISRIWPETTPEDAQMAAEAVADEMKGQDGQDGQDGTEGTELPEQLPEETTSDSREKRVQNMKDKWKGNPRFSGGRNGTTSDEDCKEQPDEETEDVKKAAEAVTAVTDPTATIVKEVVTAKPKEVPAGSKLEEAYTFSTDDPLYKRSH